MKETPSKTAGKSMELPPFNNRVINISKFKPSVTLDNLMKLLPPGGVIYFPPIETLSCIKTIGLGLTNITVGMASIVTTNTASPYAHFNPSLQENPYILINFEPSAYGITFKTSFVMEFILQTYGPITFNIGPSSPFLTTAGPIIANGASKIILTFNNVPSNQGIAGYLQQASGEQWDWYSTQIQYPPFIFK